LATILCGSCGKDLADRRPRSTGPPNHNGSRCFEKATTTHITHHAKRLRREGNRCALFVLHKSLTRHDQETAFPAFSPEPRHYLHLHYLHSIRMHPLSNNHGLVSPICGATRTPLSPPLSPSSAPFQLSYSSPTISKSQRRRGKQGRGLSSSSASSRKISDERSSLTLLECSVCHESLDRRRAFARPQRLKAEQEEGGDPTCRTCVWKALAQDTNSANSSRRSNNKQTKHNGSVCWSDEDTSYSSHPTTASTGMLLLPSSDSSLSSVCSKEIALPSSPKPTITGFHNISTTSPPTICEGRTSSSSNTDTNTTCSDEKDLQTMVEDDASSVGTVEA
jgi:hypothetical protein